MPQAVSPDHSEREGFDPLTIRITFDPSWPDDIYVTLEVSGVINSTDDGEICNDMTASHYKLAE